MTGSRTAVLSAPGSEAVELLAVLADPVRWSVLSRLAGGTRCVCDLNEYVPVAGNLLSYHLRVLRKAGLVTTRRRGRWVDYSLAPDARRRMGQALPTTVTEDVDPAGHDTPPPSHPTSRRREGR